MSGAVTVRYFAVAKEKAGCDRELIELREPTIVERLLGLIEARHAGLKPLRPHLRVAVNHEFVGLDAPVKPGDEVALIPPVAGGSAPFFLSSEPLQLSTVIDAVSGPGQGGVVTFTGAVRDNTKGRPVVRLEYEAYPEMALKKLAAIGAEAARRWPQARVAIGHRIGTLVPAELAVVIAASAPHRAEAFEACRFAIEELKRDVPIWKREVYADGAVWVGLGP